MRTKIKNVVVFYLFMVFVASCDSSINSVEEYKESKINQSLGFMPMQVGNYWGYDDYYNNYTRITSTININGEKYFRFTTISGGDGASYEYLRIDEDNNLIRSHPRDSLRTFVLAKFDAEKGETFNTIDSSSYGHYKVTVTKKTRDEMSFKYELKDKKYTWKFIKGFGRDFDFKIVRINGKEYHL